VLIYILNTNLQRLKCEVSTKQHLKCVKLLYEERNEHFAANIDDSASPALLAALLLGCFDRHHEVHGNDAPYLGWSATSRALMIMRIVRMQLPGNFHEGAEVRFLLNALFQQANGHVRAKLLRGFSLLVSVVLNFLMLKLFCVSQWRQFRSRGPREPL
jgi:hypothetical protein